MLNYSDHLKKDKILAKLLDGTSFSLTRKANISLQLMLAIMSQQLSTKVAGVFQQRFLALFSHPNPTPESVLNISYETLRSIGLSHAKATYVHEVAKFCQQHQVTDFVLQQMTDEDIISWLTQIKGVGRWTVEMLLMFSLEREDVFPIGDLGIRQAMIKLYAVRTKDKRKLDNRLEQIARHWSPFRTYACLHLWAYKDVPAGDKK